MSAKKFATCINCIDGRVQMPVIEYLKKKYDADYVDMITEPGPNRILSENRDRTMVESIKKRSEISISKHNSKLIAIAAHHDCAGNPVGKDTQWKQLIGAIKTVTSWNFGGLIIGLWVDENREVHEVME